MAIRVGKLVRVVDAFDQEIHDVSEHVGRLGKVIAVAKNRPAPWLVRLDSGVTESFWGSELRRVHPCDAQPTTNSARTSHAR
jgi:hypothetical protein